MCIYSMVHDHFAPKWPETIPPKKTEPHDWQKWIPQPSIPTMEPEIKALKDLIKEFKEALEAAKVVDKITGQPDCPKPEAVELEKRITAIEKHLGIHAG